MLAERERDIDEALAVMGGTAVTLRQHLAILRKYELVSQSRLNRKIIYSITSKGRKALSALPAIPPL
jgi:predicted transcriptional regulator